MFYFWLFFVLVLSINSCLLITYDLSRFLQVIMNIFLATGLIFISGHNSTFYKQTTLPWHFLTPLADSLRHYTKLLPYLHDFYGSYSLFCSLNIIRYFNFVIICLCFVLLFYQLTLTVTYKYGISDLKKEKNEIDYKTNNNIYFYIQI